MKNLIYYFHNTIRKNLFATLFSICSILVLLNIQVWSAEEDQIVLPSSIKEIVNKYYDIKLLNNDNFEDFLKLDNYSLFMKARGFGTDENYKLSIQYDINLIQRKIKNNKNVSNHFIALTLSSLAVNLATIGSKSDSKKILIYVKNTLPDYKGGQMASYFLDNIDKYGQQKGKYLEKKDKTKTEKLFDNNQFLNDHNLINKMIKPYVKELPDNLKIAHSLMLYNLATKDLFMSDKELALDVFYYIGFSNNKAQKLNKSMLANVYFNIANYFIQKEMNRAKLFREENELFGHEMEIFGTLADFIIEYFSDTMVGILAKNQMKQMFDIENSYRSLSFCISNEEDKNMVSILELVNIKLSERFNVVSSKKLVDESKDVLFSMIVIILKELDILEKYQPNCNKQIILLDRRAKEIKDKLQTVFFVTRDNFLALIMIKSSKINNIITKNNYQNIESINNYNNDRAQQIFNEITKNNVTKNADEITKNADEITKNTDELLKNNALKLCIDLDNLKLKEKNNFSSEAEMILNLLKVKGVESLKGHIKQKKSCDFELINLATKLDLNVKKLVSQASIRPHFSRGKPNGLSLKNIKWNSIFKKLGLQNGDIIKAVPSTNINTIDDVIPLYKSIQSHSPFYLIVNRQGKKIILFYTMLQDINNDATD